MKAVKTQPKKEKVKEEVKEMVKEENQATEVSREEIRRLCGTEIDTILKKYNCDLTAQLIVGETRIVPQVFIIDARNS